MNVRSDSELHGELVEQIEALRASCNQFDLGVLWEAKRIASTVYILVNDGGRRNRSLLTHLGLRSKIEFLTTAKRDAPLPLANINIDMVNGSFTYSPFLESAEVRYWMPFKKWYEEAVFQLQDGRRLSRKNLIFGMRNKLGGAHVDRSMEDQELNWLRRGIHTIGAPGPWTDDQGNEYERPPFVKKNIESGPVPNGHLASMRQIGFELDATFRRIGL